MTVFLNNQEVEVPSEASVLDVLSQVGMAGDGVAVAVDNKVLPRAMWPRRAAEQGMRLTVIRAVCGG